MLIYSHSEDVYYQIGGNVLGIPNFVIHKVAWYVDVKDEISTRQHPKKYDMVQRNIQKFSSTRPNRKKDKL